MLCDERSKNESFFGSAARVGKSGDRCDPENHWEDNAAVAINSYRPFLFLRVIEDDRRHNLDKGKENEQCAGQDKDIQSRHVWQRRELTVDGETISNQRQH